MGELGLGQSLASGGKNEVHFLGLHIQNDIGWEGKWYTVTSYQWPSEHVGPRGEQKGAEVKPRHQVGGAGATCRAAGRGHLDHFPFPLFLFGDTRFRKKVGVTLIIT